MPHRRGPWSNAEDRYLMQLIGATGPINWVQIAQTLGSRTPKQCRERYHQNLKPSLNHDPITPEEGLEIERLVKEVGKRWAEIARRLNNRSDNAVKNWWNGSQNRRKRQVRRRVPMPEQDRFRLSAMDHSFHSGLHVGTSTPSYPIPTPLTINHSPYGPGSGQSLGGRREPWVESSLPSPCSTHSNESDMVSRHTPSPAQRVSTLHHQVELPPVRSWPTHSPQEPQLPSLSSLAPGPPSFPTPRRPSVSLPMPSAQYGMWQPSKGQASSQGTLLTAPNSPEIHQHRHHQRTHSFPTPTQDSHQLNYQYRNHGYSASPQDGERRPSSKDSRMNLSSLLG